MTSSGQRASRRVASTMQHSSLSLFHHPYSVNPSLLPASAMTDNSRLSPEGDNEGGDDNEYPASTYNDGHGIRYKVKLIAKFPTLQAGEKRRSNAVRKHVNWIFHAHELSILGEILGYAIRSVKRDERTLDFKVVAGELRAKNFTVTWTIPHLSDKDMPLDSVDAFEDMVQQVEKKAKPEVALELVEDDDEDEDGDSSDDAEETSRSKKKKTSKSTPERTAHELEIEDEIVNLQMAHLCHDVECRNYGKLCWPDAISGKHIFLTAMHLDTWAAAIVEKVAQVNIDHAPDTRMFQLGRTAADDALLQRRKANSAITATPPVTLPMNFIFPNLADLLGAQAQRPLPLEPSQKVNFAPKFDLATFCTRYSLSEDIQIKLSLYQVTGPHTLAYLSDEILSTEAFLHPAQLGDIRDAENRWKHSVNH
ncbi:hypothetical protein EV421DRAFT_1854867 [Armillaria borealis]|uniref:Uncharacterized protein n=1 Tax=Armillaria borealis TaxID=47425 RepID=A0AA39MF27_9AGAR|nr:hypothetical protein EV421DRAFT_1854867 [Armillaria borealis]